MKSRIAFVGGFVGGYVLGSRAGRARYDQIKRRSQDFIDSPLVREKAAQAKDFAAEKAPVVGHKVSDAAAKAAESVKDTVSGGSDQDEPAGDPQVQVDAGALDAAALDAVAADAGAADAADEDAAAPTLVLTDDLVEQQGTR